VRVLKLFLILMLFSTGWGMAQESKEPKEPQREPSLVDLSRQAKSKKADGKPVRVITNEDLKRMRNAPVSTSSSAVKAKEAESSSEEAASETEEAATEDQGPDMEFWTSAFAEGRLNLKNAVNRGLVLQLRLNNLRNAFYREDDGTTQARIQAELTQTLEQFEANKTDVDEARSALKTLEDEARKAGVPPGKLRDLTAEVEDPETIITPESSGP
jgi:hypothetical protein